MEQLKYFASINNKITILITYDNFTFKKTYRSFLLSSSQENVFASEVKGLPLTLSFLSFFKSPISDGSSVSWAIRLVQLLKLVQLLYAGRKTNQLVVTHIQPPQLL